LPNSGPYQTAPTTSGIKAIKKVIQKLMGNMKVGWFAQAKTRCLDGQLQAFYKQIVIFNSNAFF